MPDQRGYTAKQAAALTGCTGHQLRYWDQIGLVTPSVQGTDGHPGRRRLYSFADLILLRCIAALLPDMSLQRVRRSIVYLRKQGFDPATTAIEAAGSTILVRLHLREGEIVDALRHGQIAFFGATHKAATEARDAEVVKFRDRDEFLEATWSARKELQSARG